MGGNGRKWDMNQILTFIGVIIALLAVMVTITTPELRNFFGLKDSNPPAPVLPAPTPQQELKIIPPKIETPPVRQTAVPKPPVIHKAKESAGPQECTIGDNKSQRIEEAETNLSIIFNEEYDIVTLTISPDGKQSSNRAVLNGYTEEFTSSAGVFLVHVLNVDWNRRTATVQVSRKR
jgi:hypothetical protein